MTEPARARHLATVRLLQRAGAATLGGAAASRAIAGLREHDDAGAARRRRRGGAGLLGRPDRRRTGRRRRDPARAARLPGRAAEHRRAGRGRRRPSPAASCGSTTTPTTSTRPCSRRSASSNDVSVRVTTFETLDEAFSKLSTGGLEFDVIFSTPDQLSRLVGRKLVQPLNYDLIPNLAKNVWPEAAEPVLRRRAALLGPVHRLHDGHRLAQRHRRLRPGEDDPVWDAMWAAVQRGKVQLLNDQREAIGMALMHGGSDDLNTENPALDQRGGRLARAAQPRVGVKVQISAYERCPRDASCSGRCGPATCSTPSSATCPRARPDVISYAYQEVGGPVFNDIITVASAATKPVLAHTFLNYMPTRRWR